MIYTSQTDVIEQQVKAARQLADFVVVGVHWGVENSHAIVDAQRASGTEALQTGVQT